MENRTIIQSLDKAWDLLSLFAKEKLSRINKKLRDEFFMREKRLFDEKRNDDSRKIDGADMQIKS